MAFETRPFNFGNTLAQAAQIQSLRNRNTLNDTLLSERNAVAEALQNDMPLNELARLNPTGLNTAMGLNQLEAGIAQLDAVRASSALTRAQIAHRAASGVAGSKNPAQAALIALRDPSVAEIFGNIDPTTMDPDVLRAEAQSLAEATAFSMDPTRLAQLQSTRSFAVQLPDGRQALATGTFNPATGTAGVSVAQLPGEILSGTGETPQQRLTRDVETTQQQTRVTQQEKRFTDQIDEGFAVLDSLPTLRRTKELLSMVNTGGRLREAQLSAKQFFGVEGANEGELSANLGKAVLSQLRQVFGAQFTEREGERLERIEAGFGRNTATNLRLIESAITLVERKIQRGRTAAKAVKDDFSVEQFDAILDAKPDETKPRRRRYNPETGQFEDV